jgi:putative ABC transport system permease protein
MAACINRWLAALGLVGVASEAGYRKRRSRILLLLVGEAWISIGNQRLRTFLAILGIVIGVGSVVLLIGIGTASQNRVERTIRALGSNILVVTPQSGGPGPYARFDFDEKDIEAIAGLSQAEMVAYSSYPSQQTAYANNTSDQTQLIGTIPDYLYMRHWALEDGRTLTPEDVRQGKRVTVIGKSLAQRLFNDSNPVGRILAVGESRIGLEIVGVLQPKGSGLNGEDQDNVAFLPTTTFRALIGGPFQGTVNVIYVQARSADSLDGLADDIAGLFRQRYRVPDTQPDPVRIHNVSAALYVASETASAFATLLTAIASISLLVGGIGIMNIMLVTVAERTREIGIRKAIGATKRDIMLQFLLEAVMISGAGSITGLLLGSLAGLAAERWLSVAVAFSPWSVALALGMSIGIGLPSGLYPAVRAARLQAIDALRGAVG